MGASLGRIRSRRIVGVVLAFALVGTLVGVVAAAVTSDPGPFTGCLGKNGDVHKVARSATAPLTKCAKDETQITFSNAQGPQGATGPKGDTGATGAGGGAVDPCAAIAGTYLQTGTTPIYDTNGNLLPDPAKYGRILSLAPGGGASVVNADNAPPFGTAPVTDSQTVGEGAWTCDANAVTARVLDFYRHDDASEHIFELDRIDFTATFASGTPATLTGQLHYCSWSMPVNTTQVQAVASPCTQGSDDVTFALTRDISMTRITLP